MKNTPLNTPYGGSLVDLVVPSEQKAEVKARAAALPSITLSQRSVHDLELLATGAFSPLTSFLGRADYARVVEEGRLANGTLWPIPITLPVKGSDVKLDQEVCLRSPKNDILAILTIREAFPWSAEEEAKGVLGKHDMAHPLVSEMRQWGDTDVSGELRVIDLPAPPDFRDLRLTPREVRERLGSNGHARVVAFQTRNPLHRSHEELIKRAMDTTDAALLLHPVVGMTRPGDVDHYTRVRIYRELVARRFDNARTLLALLPLAMRMAGPREALWHAIIRRNHGATHFIVGRDHAGPGPDSSGKPFFGPYDAQEAVCKHADELGVAMVPFKEMVYLPDEDRYVEEDQVPKGARTLKISGTQVRDEYLAKGKELPEWFTRPETAKLLRESAPARHEQGFCIWFTGLSGSGKSTAAEALVALLMERGRRVTLLDGDVVRTHLSKGLGFSPEDRDTNIRRIGWVAAEIVRHGGVAVCAAISPYRATRAEAKSFVGADRFVEVFVDASPLLCEERDVKGLWKQAREGKLKGFTGVDDPYEAPERPDVRLTTVHETPAEEGEKIIAVLEERGFLRT